MEGSTAVILLEIIFIETLIICVMIVVFYRLKKQRQRVRDHAATLSRQFDGPEATAAVPKRSSAKKDTPQLLHSLATIRNILREKDNKIRLLTERLTRLGAASVQHSTDRMRTINPEKSRCLDSIETLAGQDDRMNSALEPTVGKLRSELKSSEDKVALLRSALSRQEKSRREQQAAGDRHIAWKSERVDDNNSESSDPSRSLEQRRTHLKHEVDQLHANNRKQRELITDLYRDVKKLKVELSNASDLSKSELERLTKRIHDLERLIFEFENAIPVLESEVDRLYSQIVSFNKADSPPGPTQTGQMEEQGIAAEAGESPVSRDRAQTVLDFMQQCMPVTKEQELLMVLDETIRQLSVIPALALRLGGDSVRLIPEAYFNAADIKAFESLAPDARPGINSEPNLFLFSTTRIFVMLTELDRRADKRDEVVDLVRELCQMAELAAERLQLKAVSEQWKNELDTLLSLARNGYTNAKMGFRYQQEEMQRVQNEFIGEITAILKASDLPPPILAVLENAVVECQEQWNLVSSADEDAGDDFKRQLDAIHDRVSRLNLIESTPARR